MRFERGSVSECEKELTALACHRVGEGEAAEVERRRQCFWSGRVDVKRRVAGSATVNGAAMHTASPSNRRVVLAPTCTAPTDARSPPRSQASPSSVSFRGVMSLVDSEDD